MMGPVGLAEIGALIGDPGRASMLDALMDGRALTARELADQAGVTPQTASGHLAKLSAAGLIQVARQGRHRYHRLASAEVAQMLEGLAHFAARPGARAPRRIGPRDAALRAARTCYDHLAGQLGVALAEAMRHRGQVELEPDGGAVTPAGLDFLTRFGVDVARAQASRRIFCRPCLDWSERRPHLAGTVGAAIACRCFENGWVRRQAGTRAVAVSPAGRLGLRETFGIVWEG